MNAEEREFSKVIEDMDQVDHIEETITEQSQQWLRAADQWVRRNPYLAIGAAALVGCVIVACLRRED
jgi:ElaB/YqjD/DUF883 family membrane-anchored ribosome-binding protein